MGWALGVGVDGAESVTGSGMAAHRQHSAIVKAVAKGDADTAEQLARKHVRDSLELRLTLMRGKR